MNDKKYFIGKVEDYAQKKGWFFGHFMDEELLRSDLVEVAYQDVPDKKADPTDWHYHKKAVEINIVLSGSATFKINGETVKVEEEGFWIVYPGTVIDDFSTSENTKLVVIEAPSIPDDKVTKNS